MRFVGIIIAVVLALAVGVAVLKFAGSRDSQTGVVVDPKAPSAQVQTVNILVAAKDIPVGTTITDGSFYDQQPWPKHLVLDQFIVADAQNPGIIGKVTRSAFLSREPLIATKLANPNDPSFLAATLPEGMRVITIATDATMSVGGFVFPGDRVDVLFTHELDKEKPAPSRTGSLSLFPTYSANEKPDRATEVLVTNLKVLAVDQRSASKNQDELKIPTTVSLEVSQEAAQKIRLAEREGTLSLALRSLKDRETNVPVPPTLRQDISLAQPPKAPGNQSVIVVRGSVAKEEFLNAPSAPEVPENVEAIINRLVDVPEGKQ